MSPIRTAEPTAVDVRVDAVVRNLVLVLVALNVANALAIAYGLHPGGMWLLLGLERNPSTWFSAAQLGLAAVLAVLVGLNRPDQAQWRLVALVLAALSIDEVATVHEKLGAIPVVPGVGERAWAGAGLLLVALVAARLLPWALRLDRHLTAGLLLGGLLFVGGAVGFEVIAAGWQRGHGQDTGFWLLSSLEEDLELVGVLVVVRTLLHHLRRSDTSVSLDFAR